MADRRRGLNCSLTYLRGGTVHKFRARVDAVGHGVTMVAEESSARNQRAYYPHKAAPARFYLRVLLVGQNERDTFANWMQRYADYVMDPGLPGGERFPDMRVLVPSRNFDREGVPLTGFQWGDHIGGIVWTPTIVFETTREPQDTTSWRPSRFVKSGDRDMKYFWPSGTQLGGNAVPSGSYTHIIDGDTGTGSDPGQAPVPAPHVNGNSTGWIDRDSYGD